MAWNTSRLEELALGSRQKLVWFDLALFDGIDVW